MAKPSPLTWLPLLDRALETEIGIGFKVGGIERTYFRNTLYEARKACATPERYANLVMFLPGGDYTDEIWICNREVELDDAPTTG